MTGERLSLFGTAASGRKLADARARARQAVQARHPLPKASEKDKEPPQENAIEAGASREEPEEPKPEPPVYTAGSIIFGLFKVVFLLSDILFGLFLRLLVIGFGLWFVFLIWTK